jgi:aarF domain-containing kinase
MCHCALIITYYPPLFQVNFTKEAQHIRQFSQYLDRSGMRGVATCPFVYSQYSSRRLLTMEKLNGVPLTDLAAIRSITTADPETTLINALNTWVGSVLYCDSFHADVHAGNLLVQRDGTVAFLDFGIVGRVSPVTWKAVEALIGSVATGDYVIMAKALATMGATGTEVSAIWLVW